MFWIFLNIIILYGPIEKKNPNCLFKIYLYLKQISEGVFGLISCFIPKYKS